jgi:hypothetical protein
MGREVARNGTANANWGRSEPGRLAFPGDVFSSCHPGVVHAILPITPHEALRGRDMPGGKACFAFSRYVRGENRSGSVSKNIRERKCNAPNLCQTGRSTA